MLKMQKQRQMSLMSYQNSSVSVEDGLMDLSLQHYMPYFIGTRFFPVLIHLLEKLCLRFNLFTIGSTYSLLGFLLETFSWHFRFCKS